MQIAVASGKGRTGKTTVSTNLAWVALRTGLSIAYFDCDVEEPNGHIFLKPEFTQRRRVGRLVPQVDAEVCSVQACFDCDDTYEGFPGILNGGTVSSLLDGAMANCLFLHGHVAVTGELNVRFVRPVITNRTATVRAWIDRASPPYHALKAQVIQGNQMKAWAIGKFVNQPHLAGE